MHIHSTIVYKNKALDIKTKVGTHPSPIQEILTANQSDPPNNTLEFVKIKIKIKIIFFPPPPKIKPPPDKARTTHPPPPPPPPPPPRFVVYYTIPLWLKAGPKRIKN